jgi:hypothetical protein
MAKALELSAETLTAPPPVPKAAQIMPQVQPPAKQGRVQRVKQEAKEPLQIRWPEDEIKAAKIAALQQGFSSVSDFMLACFHAYMQTSKKG